MLMRELRTRKQNAYWGHRHLIGSYKDPQALMKDSRRRCAGEGADAWRPLMDVQRRLVE